MSLKDHIAGKKPPNPITGNRRRKPDKKSIEKKPLNPDGELKRKIGDLLRKRYYEKKVVDEKPPDPRGVLERKPTPYD